MKRKMKLLGILVVSAIAILGYAELLIQKAWIIYCWRI